MLDLDRHQGLFGEHLVQLIVTTAGYTCYKPADMGDGVDLVITHTQHHGTAIRPPNIELQVKTIRYPRLVSCASEISYDLEVGSYNALRTPGHTRRYLVIVVVPGDQPHDWHDYDHDSIIFRRAAYWQDLLGAPHTANTATTAIRVPISNRYTPEVVKSQMAAALDSFRGQFRLGEAP